MKWSLACALLVLLAAQTLRAAFMLAGPYEIVVDRFEPCENKGRELVVNLRSHKTSKDKRVLDGEVTMPFGLDDNTTFLFAVDKWGTGGWSKNAYVASTKKACSDFVTVFPKLSKAVYKAMDAPYECPLPAGHYNLTDLGITYHLDRFPMLPYGKYRAEITFIKEEEIKGCFLFFGEIAQIASTTFG